MQVQCAHVTQTTARREVSIYQPMIQVKHKFQRDTQTLIYSSHSCSSV